ncbi:hypothetical protein DPEC_G00107060 [Dallia pectoralis]|uniref:Uncharacterized protein n=1 Tax=Dallia pectoralis TaxID=75939 RepID=A0ACC2GY75_DALPE|nr:hypothetical protein DPEC_G00107060 [Dallia pectoralis]
MAAVSCPLHRTLSRLSWAQGRNTPVVCREPLWVLAVQRYGRDPGFSMYFPQAITTDPSLYDATLTDGDCRVRVTLDPSLNGLVERNVFHCGAQLRNVSFLPWLAAREEEAQGGVEEEVWSRTYKVVSLTVSEEGRGERGSEDLVAVVQVNRLMCALPLRAKRSCYQPLWNNQDHYGEAWKVTSDSIQTGSDSEDPAQETADVRPTVTLQKLREDFLSHGEGVRKWRGVAKGMLVVRVLNKSSVRYYGKSDSNCTFPYKALLEVCDTSGCVCVCVLWNSVCVCWYMRIQPGQLLRLKGYRVKERYDSRTTDQQDIEISLNSRNPSAEISILPESSLSVDVPLSRPSFSFCSGKELFCFPPGYICDIIGLVVFSGRPERIRSQISQGAEQLEYRWLRLEDGTSDQEIMIKLFSTSQPEIHNKIYPLSVVVVTRLLLVRTPSGCYLTNTVFTQVYCTGSGHHSTMPYRKLPQVRHFIQWLQSLDERQVLSRAVVGGYFIYPPPAISLETFMKNLIGEAGLLTGSELMIEVKKLLYRERRRFSIQATINMITHCRKGEEDHCLVWTDKQDASFSPHRSVAKHSSSLSPRPSSSSSFHPSSSSSFHPSSSSSFHPSSSSSFHPSSSSSFHPSSSSSFHPSSSSSFHPSSGSSFHPSSGSSFHPSSGSSFHPSSGSSFHPSSGSSFHPFSGSSFHPSSSSSPRPSVAAVFTRLSPSSSGSLIKSSPRLLMLRTGLGLCNAKSPKRRLFSSPGPIRKRLILPIPTRSEEDSDSSLWEASMEFLDGDDDVDEEEGEDGPALFTTPPCPLSKGCRLGLAHIAMETLPLMYCPATREEQAIAVGMQTEEIQNLPESFRNLEKYKPTDNYTQTGHYTLTLGALSDGVIVDAVFLPSTSTTCRTSGSTSLCDQWFSILTHGGFPPNTPPPAPADLIATASQLANQRLVCVLEACLLGGDRVELVLSRAFLLKN